MEGKKLIFRIYDDSKEHFAINRIIVKKETIEKSMDNTCSTGPSIHCHPNSWRIGVDYLKYVASGCWSTSPASKEDRAIMI